SWVKLDRALEFRFASRPIPIFQVAYLGGRNMGIANGVVQSQRFAGSGTREGNADFGVQAVIASDVALRQASVGECVSGIFLNRLTKTLTSRLPLIARPSLHLRAAAHIEEICFGIDRTLSGKTHAILRRQCNANLPRDVAGHFFLKA